MRNWLKNLDSWFGRLFNPFYPKTGFEAGRDEAIRRNIMDGVPKAYRTSSRGRNEGVDIDSSSL